jgi:hypothetical protein
VITINYVKNFEIDGYVYRLVITNTNDISFSLIKGKDIDTYDPFDWDAEFSTHEDVQKGINALKVFRKVESITKTYIKKYKPYGFSFSASTDRKVSLYNRLARKAEKIFPEYEMTIDNGAYYFYRRK